MIDEKSISVIIPVFREGKSINRLLRHISSLPDSRNVEIIVVDGSAEQDTIKAIADRGIIKVKSPRGRGIQLNAGCSIAAGEFLLFLHADTFLPRTAFRSIRETLSEDHIAAGAFTMRFSGAKTVLKALHYLNNGRAVITRIPYGDQAIFIKRSVLYKVGGIHEYMLFEDIDLMERLRRRKYKIKILTPKVITSGRRFENEGILRGVLKIILLLVLYKAGVSPDKLSTIY